MSQVLVLNGPNLNLLGTREPEKYGSMTLSDIEASLAEQATGLGLSVAFYQNNSEGALIDRVQAAKGEGVKIVILNPAGYSHTSVALRDVFLGVAMPVIEVHISNIYAREAFRHHSYFSDIAVGTLAGFGTAGYSMAMTAANAFIKNNSL
ncbi:MAG: 3-dehydroquinate dehydratase-2 [Granulosicoccus sp.]|jgi:3-dehydroquinate dehydratase-2